MKWIGQVVHGVKTNFSNDGEIYVIADDLYIENVTQDKDIIFKTNDGGTATEVMRIDGSTSRVGIGTSSPAELLHVDNPTGGSSILLEGAGGWYSQILFRTNPSAGQGWLSYDYSGNVMTFGVSNSERMRLTSAGNLGIGTTSPSLQSGGTGLHINAASYSELKFTNNTTGAGAGDGTALVTNGTSFTINNREAGYLSLGTSNAVRMYIDSAGSVGIGTSSPESLLTIKGDAITTSQPVRITSSVQDTHTALFINNLGGTIGEKYGLQFGGYNEYSIGGIFGVLDSTSGSTSGDITIDFANGTSAGDLIEKVRFTHEGNVGIGTTSPLSKMHIKDGNTLTSALTNTSLLVEGFSQSIVQVASHSSGYSQIAFGDQDDGFDGGFIYSNASRYLSFEAANTEAMRITSTGNVGIGTTSPSEKLHVSGNARIEGNLTVNGTYTQIDTDVSTTEQWLVTNDGTGPAAVINQKGSEDIFNVQDDGTSVFYIKDGGNIGIGTTSPNEALDIGTSGSNARIYFSGNAGGGGGGILYKDSGGLSRYALHFESDDKVILSNRASNGIVQIRANTSTAGVGGEKTIATFEDDQVSIDGSVGIGTTSPAYALQLKGDSTYMSVVAADGSEAVLLGADGNGDGSLVLKDTGGNNKIHLYAESGANNYINNGGNVGIGTTSPASLLHVAGTVQVGVDDTGHDVIFYGATSGRYMMWDESDNSLELTDNTKIKLGTGSDFQIYHSGSNAFITNTEGDINIINNTDNADIVFQSDDGSGGVAAYFKLDGSAATHNGSETTTLYTNWPDKSRITLGSSHDIYMYHDGANTWFENQTGDLTFRNGANDKDIIFQSDDGSGGTTAYLTLDGSATQLVASKNLKFDQDNSQIFFAGNNTFVGELSNSGKLQLRGGGSNTASTVYIDSSGNVGFGTSVPSSKLDVRGTLTVGVDDTGHDVIFYGATSGKYLQWDESSNRLGFRDSVQAVYGNDGDFKIYHDGNNTYQTNDTGHMYFINYADDSDIIFQSDNGSGGNTTYFQLDGSHTETVFSEAARFVDNKTMSFGNSSDLQIHHNGSNSYITQSGTGDLYFMNTTDDKDIIFVSDDGSGGNAEYFRLDGGEVGSYFSKNIHLSDSVQFRVGSGNDFYILHDSYDTYCSNETGDLYIQNSANDKDIIFRCDNGSGGNTAYLTLDGSATRTKFAKATQHADSIYSYFGDGDDLRIYHDGSNSHVANHTGEFRIESWADDLKIINYADDKDIIFQSDNGSGGTTAYITLDGTNVRTKFHKTVNLEDNVQLQIGNSQDLKLYHSGTHSYISQEGVGNLFIQTLTDDGDIIFMSDDGNGGVGEYFRLDGSLATHDGSATTALYTNWPDKSRISMGTSHDFTINHDGTHTYLSNNTGNLRIRNFADDSDIIFECDDGSGGATAYLTLDGSAGYTTVQKQIRFDDNVPAKFGTGNDLHIFHDSTDSLVDNYTGDLYFRQTADDKDIIFHSDNGSGGIAEYLRIDGGTEEVVFSKPIVTAETQIKVLPHQFMSNEDGGQNKSAQFRDDTIIGVRSTADDSELYAFVEIPYGKTATNVTVYGNDTNLAVNVYESDINAGALTDKTPEAGCRVGAACDITDVAYSATNYLAIKVTTTSYTNDIVYGAVVTIT